MKKYISGLVITYNEEGNIGACLDALVPVVDEVVVVDSQSTDRTVEIAKAKGARVVDIHWKGYAETKNEGNKYCEHDWILSLDADEVLSGELQKAIQDLELQETEVYALDRIAFFCGKKIRYSGWYPDWKVRLFNKQNVHWEGAFVHETLAIPPGLQTVRLPGKLWHYSYKSLDDHWQRTMKYAALSAQKMLLAGRKVPWYKYWLAPPVRFFRTFLIKRGFLDGKYGFIISYRDALLVREKYRNLRELIQQKP